MQPTNESAAEGQLILTSKLDAWINRGSTMSPRSGSCPSFLWQTFHSRIFATQEPSNSILKNTSF